MEGNMTTNRQISINGFRKQRSRGFSPLLAFVVMVAFAGFALFSFFVKEAYDETRENFLEKLNEEKRVTAINTNLKIELLAITQKGYVEFAAGERLGLKKPKEEEVVVLR
jgi:Cell division protein FtsL